MHIIMKSVRRRRCVAAIASLLIVAVPLSVPLAAEATQVGTVEALQGRALAVRADGQRSQALAVASTVFQGDIVETATDSRIRLRFNDGSVVTLGSQSTLRITEYVYDPAANKRSSLLTLTRGFFRAIVSFVAPGSRFEVDSHTAVASVRGTDWMGRVTDDLSEHFVIDGIVAVAPADRSIGGTVELSAGNGTTVLTDMPPTAPKAWPRAKIDRFLDATTLNE